MDRQHLEQLTHRTRIAQASKACCDFSSPLRMRLGERFGSRADPEPLEPLPLGYDTRHLDAADRRRPGEGFEVHMRGKVLLAGVREHVGEAMAFHSLQSLAQGRFGMA